MRPIATLIDLYSLVVLAAVVFSWGRVDPRTPLVNIVYRLTEPALAPVRQVLPVVGGLDFSPMVLLLLLRALRSVF